MEKLLANTIVDYAKAIGSQNIYLFTADKADFYQPLRVKITQEGYMGEKVTIIEYKFSN